MTDPGTLIPSDGGVTVSREYEQQSLFPSNHFNIGNDKSSMNVSSFSVPSSSVGCSSQISGATKTEPSSMNVSSFSAPSSSVCCSSQISGATKTEPNSRENPGSRDSEAESKLDTKINMSQTSPAARRKKKVKDVSKYMINAAKENPKLAQKLHDVLVESGVEAPPDLFSELSAEPLDDQETTSIVTYETEKRSGPHGPFLPNLSPIKSVDGAGTGTGTGTALSNMPVAAAAVATAAVVASSMVVAAAKSNSDVKFEVPVAAAAATVTAAAVVATTAAVSGNSPISNLLLPGLAESISKADSSSKGSRDDPHEEQHDDGDVDHEKNMGVSEAPPERSSDKSTGTESTRSDVALDDVAELEIQWEEIIIGERIGLGIISMRNLALASPRNLAMIY